MKNIKFKKEILKLVLLIVVTVIAFILGNYVIEDKSQAGAAAGMTGAGVAMSLFQLSRIINFVKDPKKYDREIVDLKDERNNTIIKNSKASAYDIETFLIFGITLYAVYLNNINFVLAVGIIWVTRIVSFLYNFSKNNKMI